METKEQVLNVIRNDLNKWLNHSVRGMKSGNPAYFQGKITLIHDLLGLIYDIEFEPERLPRFKTFQLKSEPSVTLTAPESLVNKDKDGWVIRFIDENDSPRGVFLMSREWELEQRGRG